jgi:photosystem II stability/assembly factor-like uncharacterized protein
MLPTLAHARHTRVYAVVAGNDDPKNNMAGSSLGSGLWQSDDTGRTWKQLGWKHIKAFSMAHDSLGRVLYLAAGNGVLKSTDFGDSWKVLTDWRVAEVMDLLIHPAKPNLIIAATAHGVIRSTDAGSTWKPAHRGIKQPYSSRIYCFNEVLYVCTESGLYYSEDEAKGWKLIEGSPGAVRAATQVNAHVMLAGDSSLSLTGYKRNISKTSTTTSALWDVCYWPAQQGYIVAGQRGVGVSMLEGTIDFSGPKNVHALAAVGDHVLAGTLGDGVWISDNLTDWRQLGLPKSQVWSLKTVVVE